MQLQGCDLGALKGKSKLKNFGHDDMKKLAGNAFSSNSLSVAVTIGLTVLGPHLPDLDEFIKLRLDNMDKGFHEIMMKARQTVIAAPGAKAQAKCFLRRLRITPKRVKASIC